MDTMEYINELKDIRNEIFIPFILVILVIILIFALIFIHNKGRR
jgi:hypothetical protein